jgi:chlorite dismutase
MMGRTYAIGYEPELRDWLLDKPRRNATDPDMPWAVWYPLRRTGDFANLPAEEQRGILAEHGRIGLAYGQKGLARDIRLACHGMDTNDNEFVIGLIGSRLHPLSHLVQRLRATKQTAGYIQNMGPFFIGHAVWQKAEA